MYTHAYICMHIHTHTYQLAYLFMYVWIKYTEHIYIYNFITFIHDCMDCGILKMATCIRLLKHEFVNITIHCQIWMQGQRAEQALKSNPDLCPSHPFSSKSSIFLLPIAPFPVQPRGIKSGLPAFKKWCIFSCHVGVLLISRISAYFFSYNQACGKNSPHLPF